MGLRLEDIELIKQLKYRYQLGIDTCDLATLETLFIEEASAIYVSDDHTYQMKGRKEIIAFIKASFHAGMVTSHRVHEPIVAVAEDGLTAEGQFMLEDYYYSIETNKALRGAAIYRDKFVLRESGWKFAHVSFTRLFAQRFDEQPHELTSHLLGKQRAVATTPAA